MKIVVGVDGSPQQPDALQLGARLAGREPGSLTVAYVYPWSKWSERLGTAYARTEREQAEAILAAARRHLGELPADLRPIPALSAPRALHALAEELVADAIVLGSSHRGPAGRATLGGTADRVMSGAPCPVAVAPRGYAADGDALRRIGVAYDGTEDSRVALAWAEALAARTGGSLTLVTVVEPVTAGIYPPAAAFGYAELKEDMRRDCRRRVDAAVASLPARTQATSMVLDGPRVVHSICDAAAGFDLLVVGSRGYGPLGRLLTGSVSRGIVHHSEVPVVVVPRVTEARAEAAVAEAAVAGVL
jgi:nucleotide-binding universal stress UspA family protein